MREQRRLRPVRAWPLLVMLTAGGAVAPAEGSSSPLVLPSSVSPSIAGTSLTFWVFGVAAPAEPPVLGTNGLVASFEWGGSSSRLPPGARELSVETAMARGKLFLQVAASGGVVESNRVRLDSQSSVFAEAPDLPQLVPWSSMPMSSVLIVARDFGSGRLVDLDGSPLPIGSFTCSRPDLEWLREVSMQCVVTRQGPLEAGGFSGNRVRALVQTPEGPVLTPAVMLP